MFRTSLRSLRSRPLRTALTTIAILLGVAMISGTYVLTDQITNGFNDIFKTAYAKTSVVVSPKQRFGSGGDAGSASLTLPQSLLASVQAVPGVAAADGGVSAFTAVFVDGKQIKSNGAPTFIESIGDPRFSTGTWIAGRAPRKTGEVAVPSLFAKKHGLSVGDQMAIVAEKGMRQVHISGIYHWPAEGSLGGTIMVDATRADVQRWFGLEGKLSSIQVAAAPGVTPEQLRDHIRAALPATVDVKTGEEQAADSSAQTSKAINSFLRPALLAFGGVSVFVGAFIIFNAFSITVAQRRREFAMLRALGASRRQVLAGVIVEALTMGLAASLLGLVAGVGVAAAINALFKAVGADIPTAGVALAPRTVLIALIVGVGVTLVSALIPAVRATRVPPVAALSEGAATGDAGSRRLSTWAAVATTLLGGAAIAAGMLSSAPTTTRLLEMGGGAVLVFVALAVLARYVVRPLAMAIGRPLQWLAPSSGRLARENAARNPQRTAATAAALMIGLALVVFVAVFAQGLKTSFIDALAKSNRADVVVSDDSGMMSLPPAGAAAVKALPDVQTAAGFAVGQVKAGSRVLDVAAVDSQALPSVWHFQWLHGGSDALLARLDGTNAVVEEEYAKSHGLRIGSRFTAMSQAGKTATLTIIGEYHSPMTMNGVGVSDEVFKKLGMPLDATVYLVKGVPGVSPDTLKAEVATRAQGLPDPDGADRA